MKKIHLFLLMLICSSALLAQNTVYSASKTYSANLRSRAEAGDPFAMNNLGSCLDRGDGIAQNHAEALKWFKKAAEAGNFLAQYNLGQYYYLGIATQQDFVRARYWYEQSANDTHANFGMAQEVLANMYYNGIGTPRNHEKALYWYEKAAFTGRIRAQVMTAQMYYNGEGTFKDYEKALYWYEKATDAGATAHWKVGSMYYNGEGTPKNYEKALYWFQKAANDGNNLGLFLLGLMYYNGEGVRQDKSKALSYWEQAVNAGWNDARIMYLLGTEHYTASNAKTVTYLQMAVNSPEIDNAAKGDALQKLSACYRFGRCGVGVNEKKADELMRQAAACGNPDAEKIQEWLKSK